MFSSPFPEWVGFATASSGKDDLESAHAEELASLSPACVPDRRATFALGRIAARRAAASLGYRLAPLLAGSDGAPRWPAPLIGTISHVNGYAVAAVAPIERAGGIGIDVEDVDAPGGEPIESLIADPGEQYWIGRDRCRLIAVFSAKEAIFKAFYPRERRFFDFDAVHLDATATGFVARLRRTLGGWAVGSECSVLSQRHGRFVLSSVLLPANVEADSKMRETTLPRRDGRPICS